MSKKSKIKKGKQKAESKLPVQKKPSRTVTPQKKQPNKKRAVKKKTVKRKATPKTPVKNKKAVLNVKARKKTRKAIPKPKVSPKSKYKKKRGRKPSAPNRYNIIKSEISAYYLRTVGRNVKQYEMKILYNWIKETYASQPVRYVTMNIDTIVDTFWAEYCNLYPVDISALAPQFDWYNFKTILSGEVDFHYPSDIIEVDLSQLGAGNVEFFMEDYVSGCDDYYQACVSAGIRNLPPQTYPYIFLVSANCDIAKKGNVYKYYLSLDGNAPISGEETLTEPTAPTPPTTQTPSLPQTETAIPKKDEPAPQQQVALTPDQQIELEVQKERVRSEYNFKNEKLKELGEFLRNGIITFEQYTEAVKNI